jgi:predicted thioesterase
VINPFQKGDIKIYSKIVQAHEKAAFDSGVVHDVYSTFYLAKDAEWSTRLFVLEMKEPGEEGIGTFIHIDHLSPALIGQRVEFIATLEEVKGNEVICSFVAKVKDRLIATGRTGQKILSKSKLSELLRRAGDQPSD